MATETITKTIDDLTGKEISQDEVIVWEVEFNGESFKIDTTEANRDKAVDKITELLDPSNSKRLLTSTSTSSTSATKVPDAAEKARRIKVVEAFNAAHPKANAARYSKTVQAWEASR